jgi:hypothetical protein
MTAILGSGTTTRLPLTAQQVELIGTRRLAAERRHAQQTQQQDSVLPELTQQPISDWLTHAPEHRQVAIVQSLFQLPYLSQRPLSLSLKHLSRVHHRHRPVFHAIAFR